MDALMVTVMVTVIDVMMVAVMDMVMDATLNATIARTVTTKSSHLQVMFLCWQWLSDSHCHGACI